jgi:hypothetical protein
MPPITINRTPFNALIDDSGNNLDGSLWDKNGIKVVLLDPIDVALAKVPVDAATGKIPDSALSTNIALLNRASQIFSTQQIFSGVLQAAGPAYLDGGTFVRNTFLGLQSGQLLYPTTQNPTTDPNCLDDYEEGTWTPIDGSGAGLVLTGASGLYVKVGSQVLIGCTLTFPSTANAGQVTIGGLPFPANASANLFAGSIGYTSVNAPHTIFASQNTTTCLVFTLAGAGAPNNLYSGKSLSFSLSYRTT